MLAGALRIREGMLDPTDPRTGHSVVAFVHPSMRRDTSCTLLICRSILANDVQSRCGSGIKLPEHPRE